MTSNELFALLAPECAIATLITNVVLVAVYCLRHKKSLKSIKTWMHGIAVFIAFNAILVFVFMFFGFFLVPPTIAERTVNLKPEVITKINVVEKENIIEVPSIMLPLNPSGTQAVVIDSTSAKMEPFMKQFYGENVYFFNNRQDATFLLQENGLQNYSGLDISQIEYYESIQKIPLHLDKLGFETIWLFSDLSHIEFTPTNCNVILYVPYQLTEEQVTQLKTNGNITIITIESLR